MSGGTTSEGADLRRTLPLGGEILLEWNAAFRVHSLVEEHLGGSPPRVRVSGAGDGPRAEEGTVVLVRGGDGAKRSWAGTVIRLEEDSLILEVTPDRGNCRSYFRMPVRLGLRIFPGAHESEDRAAVRTTQQLIARVTELGGGGCRFVVAPGLVEEGETYRARLQLEPDRTPLELRLYLVRASTHPDGQEFAAAFLNLRESERQRILRRLFDEYRRIRKGTRVKAGGAQPHDPAPRSHDRGSSSGDTGKRPSIRSLTAHLPGPGGPKS